jgi:phenylpropionate dioxygenase-like ring-hydroxylating dioxygenase large terminal subunit
MLDQTTKSRLHSAIEALARVSAQSDDGARGVDPCIYTSEELLELEQERIFAKEWACVGRVDELPNPGDFMTTPVGKAPVIINRRSDGSLGAMLNVCAHRLAAVAEGRGNTPRFACPYHGWSYDEDGRLLFAAHMPAEFDKSACSLGQMGLEVWNGYIYVNPDPDAPSLAERLAPLTELFRNYRLGDMRIMHKGTEIWEGNWKVATENFLESYHLAVVHANSIGGMAPMEAIRMAAEGPWYAFHQVGTPPEAIVPMEGSLQLENPDISDEERMMIYAGCVFPNHLFTVQHDQVTWMRTQPISADRTLIEWGIAGAFDWPGDEPDPEHPEFYYLREMPQVNQEDRDIVASVQVGAKYGKVMPARLHPIEHGLLTFARYVDRQLRGPENTR